MIYNDYRLDVDMVAYESSQQRHKEQMGQVIEHLQEALVRKEGDYNTVFSWSANCVFGDFSWGTYIVNKSHRLCSQLVRGKADFDTIEEILYDLATYVIAYIAWRRLKHPPQS